MPHKWAWVSIILSLTPLFWRSYPVASLSPWPVWAAAPPPQAQAISQIIFTDNRDGATDIFMVSEAEVIALMAGTPDPNGSTLTNLTQTPHIIEAMPQWSTDGKRIYFTVENSAGFTSLYTIRPNGAEPIKLFDWPHPITAYDVSPDGAWVVYSAGVTASAACAIFKIRIDGSDLTQLTNKDNENQCDSLPHWSPDGRLILFISHSNKPGDFSSNLFTMQPDGSHITPLTAENWRVADAVWSPNGQMIAIGGATEPDGPGHLYVMRVDSGRFYQVDNPNITDGGGSRGDYDQIAWSPDGKKLIVRTSTYKTLGVLDLVTGGGVYGLIYGVDLQNARQPDWSPCPADAAARLTPTPVLTPTTLSALKPELELTAAMLADETNNHLHDLILFSSSVHYPFAGLRLGLQEPYERIKGDGYFIEMTMPQLWAVSPDGQRAGRLTQYEWGVASYVPSNPAGKPILVEYGVHFNNEHLHPIKLPPECLNKNTFDAAPIGFCHSFQFSPDGQYLGYDFARQNCGEGIIIMDTLTGAEIYRFEGNGHGFDFLKNGKVLLGKGHCEGGGLELLDPVTKSTRELGMEGNFPDLWNNDESAFVVSVGNYYNLSGTLWGYSVTQDDLFLEAAPFSDRPVWDPDGTHLLYQYRPVDNTSAGYNYTGSRQIIRVDTVNGEKKVLASDPAYDYDLCEIEFNSYKSCEQWYGDWIQLRRFPFQPLSVSSEGIPVPPDSNSQLQCLLYGKECAAPPELFALNWRTGELLPWAEAPLPPPTPTPPSPPTCAAKPDLNRRPLYTHPAGRYSFYVGNDNKSLWLVPQMGQPVLWVQEGENFMYVP